MTENLYEFEVSDIKTVDDYLVNLKGFVGYKGKVNQANIQNLIHTAGSEYINTIPLIEALNLINSENSKNLLTLLNKHSPKSQFSKIEIRTVDGAEIETDTDIDVSVDPLLENQTKSKGIWAKIKSLFGMG